MANNGRFEYTIGFKTDDSGLKQARKALQEIQNLTTRSPGMEGMDAELTNAKTAAIALETALTKAFNVKMGTTSVAKLNEELRNLDLSKIHSELASIGPQGEAAFNKITVQAMKTNLQIKKGNTILEKFGKTLLRNVEWLISGNLINTVTGVFTRAYGFTKNLDSSLNDIRIVTGKSADEMSRFGEEAQKVAAELGKGTTDITNASLIFYQQGLDQAEVNARTEVTAKMSNVTKQSAETVADQMTAIWNGFKVGSDELEHYADVMTAIAASTASSSQELAGSISKVASIANTTGVDMEQLSAMISTVISVTRDSPETVGTAFKTIFARINDLVEDGTDEFGVSLGRISSHLAAMGIEILNEDGTLRDLGDTLTETGEKWSSYSREQQIAIAEQMGGKRQWNQVLALFDNWDMYSDALDVAKNSMGALQDQQDIYMESTQAHLQEIKTAWEGVYGEMMSSDDINTVADSFTNILDKVHNFLETIGGIKPILISVAGILMQTFSDKFSQRIMTIGNNFKTMSYNMAEQSASLALTERFGQIDNSLLKELTMSHAKILRYQKEISAEQRDEYYRLLDARTEAENKYNILKKEDEELQKVLKKHESINQLTHDSSISSSQFQEEVAARQAHVQEMVDTQSVQNNNGRNISLQWTQEDQQQSILGLQRMEEIEKNIVLIQEKAAELRERARNATDPEKVEELRQKAQAYEGYNQQLNIMVDLQRSAANGTNEAREALKNHQASLEESYKKVMQYKDIVDGDILKNIAPTAAINSVKLFNNTLDKTAAPAESAKRKINEIKAALEKMGKQGKLSQEDVARLTQKYEDFGKSITNNVSRDTLEKGFNDIAKDVVNTGNLTIQELDTIMNGLSTGVSQRAENARNQVESLKTHLQDFISGLDTQHVVNSISKLAGSMTQLVSLSTSLTQIGKIFADDDITAGEKFIKILQTASFFLPTIISYAKTFRTMAYSKSDIAHLQNKIKANEALVASTNRVQYTNGQVIITEYQYKKAIEDNIIAEGTDLATVDKQTLAKIQAIPVEQARTTATKQAAAAQKELNAAQKANAFLAVASVVMMLVTAIVTLTNSIKANREELQKQQKELREETYQTNSKIIEQANSLKSAGDSVQTFFKKYSEGKASIEDVNGAIDSFSEKLNATEQSRLDHLTSIAKLTGVYDELAAAIQGVIDKEEKAERAAILENYENELENTKEALEQDVNEVKFSNNKGDTQVGAAQKYQIVWDENEPTGQITDSGGQISATGIGVRTGSGTSTYGAQELEQVNKMFNTTNIITDFTNGLVDIVKQNGIDNEYQLSTIETYMKEALRDESRSFDPIAALKTAGLNSEQIANVIDDYSTFFNEYYTDNYDVIKEIGDGALTYMQQGRDLLKSRVSENFSSARLAKIQSDVDAYVDTIHLPETLEDMSVDNIKTLYGNLIGKLTTENRKENWGLSESAIQGQAASIIQKIAGDNENVLEKVGGAIQSFDFDKFLSSKLDVTESALAQAFAKGINNTKLEDSFNYNDVDWKTFFSGLDETQLTEVTRQIKEQGQLSTALIYQLAENAKKETSIYDEVTADFEQTQSSLETLRQKAEANPTGVKKLLSSKSFENFSGDLQDLLKVFSDDKKLEEYVNILLDGSEAGTQKYTDALKYVSQYLDQASIGMTEADKQLKESELYKFVYGGDQQEIPFELTLDSDEWQSQMDDILNSDYQIVIDTRLQLQGDFNNLKEEVNNIITAGSKIGENFKIGVSDLEELEKALPGVSKNMTILADGSIQLDQQAVQSAKDAAKARIKGEYEYLLAAIKVRREDIKKKIAAADQIIAIAENTDNQEIDSREKAVEINETLEGAWQGTLTDFRLDSLEDVYKMSDDEFKDAKAKYAAQGAAAEKYYKELARMRREYREGKDETEIGSFSAYDGNIVSDSGIYGGYNTYEEFLKAEVIPDELGTDSARREKFGLKNKKNNVKTQDQFEQDWWEQTGSKNWKDYLNNNKEKAKEWKQELLEEDALLADQESNVKTWEESQLNQINNVRTLKDNTKAIKDNVEVQQELLDLLNEEIDAYHDVNVEIERNTTALNRLQKAQEKASGQSLIKNLEDQIKAYNELNQSLEEKQGLNYTKAIAYRAQLENQGITFNEDGTIANYSERLRQEMTSINADLEWYNNLGGEEQKSYKDWINGRTKELDDLKELISNYETLWNKEIPDLADEIAENVDKQVELQLEIETAKIKIVVDEGSLKRTELEISKIKNHLQDTNILGNLTYDAQVLFSYRDSGEEKALKDRYEKLKAVVDEARMKGAEIDQRILDSFKTAQDEYLKYIQEAAERTVKIVTDVFDRLDKRIERQKTQIETINKIFEHDMNLVKLRYGDSAYQQLTTLYEARERVSKVQLQNAQVRIQAIQQALQQARENNLGDDVIQQYEDQLASALESQRQAIDDYLNLVKEKATNAIDEVFAHLDEQLAGTSLEEVKIEWDWTNKDTDDYYDTINAAYELEKLRNQMRKAINETDDVATQKALNDLMNDELKQLQQKDKLSKYDIERANALFDIEQKRAAFREAQNNKSKMRLRRDSSGNYSYQFVADEDRVTSAMQDLADAQNSLYNIDKEAYKNNLDKMYGYYEEFIQKMKEAAADGATEEELLKIQEDYATRLGDLQQELYEKANNLEQVALDERQRMTGESWEELAVIEKNVLMGDIVPTWNTALATMMQNPDLQKFLQIASAEAIDIAQGATATVEATIQTNIGTSLEDLVNGADPAVDAISRMTESVISLETELNRLVAILSSMSGITLEGGEVLQDITNSGKQYADGVIGLTTGNQTTLDSTLQTATQGWINLISQAHQNTTETTERAIGAAAIHRREYPDTTQARIDYLKMVEQYKENIQNLVKSLNLNEPIAAIDSRIAALNKTNSQAVQPSYITNNIQADFPAVNSAQEIQMALEMLMNQATQSAFNTLK